MKKPLTGAWLKYIAMASMLIDHFAVGFYGQNSPAALPFSAQILYCVLRGIGRTAFPVFCFLISEGVQYTRNRRKYLANILILAFISQLPFQWCVYPNDSFLFSHLNTCFTLALGLICSWVYEYRIGEHLADGSFQKFSVQQKWINIGITAGTAGACCFAAHILKADYGFPGVLAILLFAIFRNNRLIGAVAVYAVLSVANPNELLSFPFIPLLFMYNGKRGNMKHKYLFYWFYPVHLACIAIAAFLYHMTSVR